MTYWLESRHNEFMLAMFLSQKFSATQEKIRLNPECIIALSIIGIWAISLIILFLIDTTKINIVLLIIAMLWQTFLYSGLFITAHDAMHGAIFPKNYKLNNLIGSLTGLLYGLFDYKDLLKKHWLHHKYPGSELDPDFHDSQHKNALLWYFCFMKRYWNWQKTIGLMLIYNIFAYILHIPEINLNLFWVIPSIVSSVQLFYFGTYLPHREPKGGYTNSHRTQSIPLPIFWSFITCYHFCYHKEHHEYPHLPWWRLPEVYQAHTDMGVNKLNS